MCPESNINDEFLFEESELDPHTRIFGCWTDFIYDNEELKDFLTDFHAYITNTTETLGKSLAEREKVKRLHYEDPEVLREHRFATSHGHIFRESFIISLAIIIEKYTKQIADIYRKNLDLKLKSSELNGRFMEQFKTYFSKVVDSGFPFGKVVWRDLNGIVAIRNCIVHKGGDFEHYERKVIELFYKEYSDIVPIHQTIITNEALCWACLNITNSFFEEVFKIALQRFPDPDGDDHEQLWSLDNDGL